MLFMVFVPILVCLRWVTAIVSMVLAHNLLHQVHIINTDVRMLNVQGTVQKILCVVR